MNSDPSDPSQIGIDVGLKRSINRSRLWGAAQKLKDKMSQQERNHFDVQIQKKWLQSRKELLKERLENRAEQENQGDVQYELDLLDCDEKQQFPHRILFYSLNQKHGQRYIPGNFIHRQFSAYCKYFINKYYEMGKIDVFKDKFIQPKEIQVVKDYVKRVRTYLQGIKDRISEDKKRQINSKGDKFLKNLIKIAKLENSLKTRSQLPKLFAECRKSLLQITSRQDLQNLRQNLEQSQRNVEKIIRDYVSDHKEISARLNTKIVSEQRFRKEVGDHALKQFLGENPNIPGYIKFYTQSSQKRNRLIEDYLAQWKKEQDNKIRTLRIRYNSKERVTVLCNFGLGRLSYVRDDSKYIVLKPFSFHPTSFNQTLESKNNNGDIELCHPEKQIMRQAIKRISQFTPAQKQAIQVVVIDIFTQRQSCSRNSIPNYQYTNPCNEYMPKQKQEIEKIIGQGKRVLIRASFNDPDKRKTEGDSGRIKEHQVEVTDAWSDDQLNSVIPYLYKPEYVFAGQRLNQNAYQGAMKSIKEDMQDKRARVEDTLLNINSQDIGFPFFIEQPQ